MKNIIAILFLNCCVLAAQNENPDLNKLVSIDLTGYSYTDATREITSKFGLTFSYTSNVLPSKSISKGRFNNQSLEYLLNSIFGTNGIEWLLNNNQVIIRASKNIKSNYYVEGIVKDVSTHTGIAYATIEIKGKQRGVVADHAGRFEFSLTAENFNDSLVFSCMGYDRHSISLKEALKTNPIQIALNASTVVLPTFEIHKKDIKIQLWGNKRNRSISSLYLDTHGQQVALYIKNEDARVGKIRSVQFYLCKEGNTEVPFRVRLYFADTATGKPSADMIEDILVVKPNEGKGWYKVDLQKLFIALPKDGFFVAIEGIFPDDYDFYYQGKDFDLGTEQEIDFIENDEFTQTVSYGQRIGYARQSGENNTWHYSLSHTWFQIRKQALGVMIAAEVEYSKEKIY